MSIDRLHCGVIIVIIYVELTRANIWLTIGYVRRHMVRNDTYFDCVFALDSVMRRGPTTPIGPRCACHAIDGKWIKIRSEVTHLSFASKSQQTLKAILYQFLNSSLSHFSTRNCWQVQTKSFSICIKWKSHYKLSNNNYLCVHPNEIREKENVSVPIHSFNSKNFIFLYWPCAVSHSKYGHYRLNVKSMPCWTIQRNNMATRNMRCNR